jgi:tetraacyldisaccharide 4'-kinase
VTTAKDAVRLPPDFWPHATVLKVRLAWDDPSAPDQLLRNLP